MSHKLTTVTVALEVNGGSRLQIPLQVHRDNGAADIAARRVAAFLSELMKAKVVVPGGAEMPIKDALAHFGLVSVGVGMQETELASILTVADSKVIIA